MAYTPNYVKYSGTPFAELVKSDLSVVSWFQNRFPSGSLRVEYDTQKYPFRDLVGGRLAKEFGFSPTHPLELLHEVIPRELQKIDLSGQNAVSTSMYDGDQELKDLYRRFIREVVVGEILKTDVYYQATPTYRVSFAETEGYVWRPNYHTDIILGHPPQEINIWIPFSECFGSNSLIYAELSDSLDLLSSYGYDLDRYGDDLINSDDLQLKCETITKPFSAKYGEMLIFDSRCLHLSPKNTSNRTRVSMDVRVIPVTEYDAIPLTYVGTGRARSRFEPGGYYERHSALVEH